MLNFQRLYRSGPLYQSIVALRDNGTAYTLRLHQLDGSFQETPLTTQLLTSTWSDVELVYDWSGAQPRATAYLNGAVIATLTDSTVGTQYPPDSAYVGQSEDQWTQQAEAQWDSVSVGNGVQSTSSIVITSTPTAVAIATPTAGTIATPIGPTATPASTSTGTDEWNQDGHDAQHTGSTTEEPTEGWSYAWSWNGPDANGGGGNHFYDAPLEARTVVGAGNLFVPAGAQGLYALAQSDGHVVWHSSATTFDATPAYDPTTGALFAGGADGNLYKFNTATGQVLGTFAAGSALNKAVTLATGAAYVVDTNGALHKLSTSTMAQQWLYSACTASCDLDTMASYSASRDVLVFATGDLYVHAVNNSNGTAKWRVRPTTVAAGVTSDNPMGYTFARGMPALAEQHGLVLLRLQLNQNSLYGYPPTGTSSGIFPTDQTQTQSWLQANVQYQNLFALSLDTGSKTFVPASGYGSEEGLINGSPYGMLGTWPVVKHWSDGSEVAYSAFRAQTDPTQQLDYRWDSHVGEMVLDSTTIANMPAGTFRYVGMERGPGTAGYLQGSSYSYITDEQQFLTLAGSSLFYTEFEANSSTRILDRSPGLGLTYTQPFQTAAHPVMVHQLDSTACAQSPNPITHWATCSNMQAYPYSRNWPGPGFWMYWNSVVGPNTGTASDSLGYRPRYSYVSNGLIVMESNGGDIFVLRHAASAPGTATTTPTAAPTATATSTPTAMTIAVPASTATTSGPLAIGSLTSSATSLAQYAKLELTVPISGSVATNLQFPYDPIGAPGLAPAIGLSVEGEFLPPSQTDWSTAVIQSGFLYQDYQRQQVNGQQWLYPQNNPVWKIRFAAQQQGTWQVRVRAQDASICSTGVSPCTSWARSNPISFSVSPPAAGNHGFVQVSPNDTRYFSFSDGTPFIGQGFDDSFGGDTYQADSKLATDAANGVTFLRTWMSGQDIVGSSWSPWWVFGAPGYGGYLPEPGLQNAPSGSGHDFVFQLTPSQPCIMNGFTQGRIGVKPSTNYRLTTTVQVSGLTAANSSAPAGFAVKTGDWPTNNTCPGGVVPSATLVPETGNTSGFVTLSGSLNTSSTQQFLDNLYLMLNNASAGQAQVTSVSLQEVLAGGLLGPNLVAKGNSDMHEDFNQPASWAYDHVLDQAAQNGVYLKMVVLEKNDRLWNRINADGSLGTNDTNNTNFYATPGTKVRQLQQYYWRYLAARWGYATSVHSWELVNEGDGGSGHASDTDAFAKYIHQADPSRHMVSSSIWAGFPVDTFWANPQFPNIDYADLHAYVSTGFGTAYPWDAPSGTSLETNPLNTYQQSAGAISIPAGVTAGTRDLPIRGQGTWTVTAMVKASGLTGNCPYGAPSSMAGPQIDLSVSGGPHVVVPSDPTNPTQYWICTAPAGTYDYSPVQGSFTLTDGVWHTLSLRFQTSYATAGTAWYDNLVVTSPDGRTARVYGTGSFDDHARFDYDSALFNPAFGLLDGAHSVSGSNKPLVRGETGIDNAGGPQTELPQLANDTHGVWLHNLLWGSLNPGGMYDLYWWLQNITTNNLFFQYKPVHDFLSGIPFSNGLYQDAQATVSIPTSVAAIGQKDLVNRRGYLWIRSLAHTWYNVVNNIAWGRLSGTVNVSGLTPNAAYAVDLWQFDNPGNLTRTTIQITADATGALTVNLASLPSTVTDVAIQFRPA